MRADVLFCDDIRYETGNKISLIGLYGTKAKTKSLPASFPLFCIFVKITGRGKPPKDIEIRVATPKEKQIIDIPEVKEENVFRSDNEFIFAVPIKTSNLVIEKPNTFMEVSTYAKGRKIGSSIIRFVQEEEREKPSATSVKVRKSKPQVSSAR